MMDRRVFVLPEATVRHRHQRIASNALNNVTLTPIAPASTRLRFAEEPD